MRRGAGCGISGARREQLIVDMVAQVQQMRALLECVWPASLDTAKHPFRSVTWAAAMSVVCERGGGDPRRFRTARALVKHAGLAPREKLSGTFTGRTKLTGQGRPGLRLAAWRAVWGAQRANPVYAARYRHLTGREHNNLTPTQAQAAIAAAILRHLHAVVTTGQRWNPDIATHGTQHRPSGACRCLNIGGHQRPIPQAGRPGRAPRGIETPPTVISPDIMGSPARRLINPITRCWVQPHHRYAGTDDGRGTDRNA
jgi:hypothetical protein